jgi:hypothetical protein
VWGANDVRFAAYRGAPDRSGARTYLSNIVCFLAAAKLSQTLREGKESASDCQIVASDSSRQGSSTPVDEEV